MEGASFTKTVARDEWQGEQEERTVDSSPRGGCIARLLSLLHEPLRPAILEGGICADSARVAD